MKKPIIFFSACILVCLIVLSYPIQFPALGTQTYENGKFLLEYEIVGCGSIVPKVIQGGESLTASLRERHPDIGTNEVAFTDDSDTPLAHLASAEFKTAGLASGFQYVVQCDVIGTTRGAQDCCDPAPVYHQTVPLVRVTSWHPTRWMPYCQYDNMLLGFFLTGALLLSGAILVILLVIAGVSAFWRRHKTH